MKFINVLPPHVFNLLAAGEVVENPSSIVKECVENSLDASAKRVEITIRKAGMEEITIIDDGEGVSESEVEKVFLPHSTSKVATAADISKINTLGFRGEALSSIAAVAKITFTTKTKSAKTATVLTLDGGVVSSKSQVASGNGTTISIRNVFFNTPARKKFLASETTQKNKIVDLVQRLALANPQIHFALNIDGNETDYPTASLIERISKMYDKSEGMLEIAAKHPEQKVQLRGYISNPTNTRPNKSYCTTMINGRVISGGVIQKAVIDAFATYASKDAFPVFVLDLIVDAETIDVNVHPRKAEVRFEDEKLIYNFVKSEIHNAIDKYLYEKDRELKGVISEPKQQPKIGRDEQKTDEEKLRTIRYFASGGKESEDEFWQPDNIMNFYSSSGATEVIYKEAEAKQETIKDVDTRVKVLGTIFGSYIAIESGNAFIMVDQHAAAERIMFDKLKNQIDAQEVEIQPLLEPYVLYLNPVELNAFSELIPQLSKIGFEMSEFGNNCIRVSAVPLLVARYNLVGDICKSLRSDLKVYSNKKDLTELLLKKVASIACHASIRAGEHLTNSQIKAFLDQFKDQPMAPTCPHGRPIFTKQTKAQLEKSFGRK